MLGLDPSLRFTFTLKASITMSSEMPYMILFTALVEAAVGTMPNAGLVMVGGLSDVGVLFSRIRYQSTSCFSLNNG